MNKKLRNRRKDIVSFDDVDDFRKRMNLKKNEMQALMGLSPSQWRNCEKKGGFLSFHFYAAVDALENFTLKQAIDKMKLFHKAKSGLNID